MGTKIVITPKTRLELLKESLPTTAKNNMFIKQQRGVITVIFDGKLTSNQKQTITDLFNLCNVQIEEKSQYKVTRKPLGE